MSQSLYTCPHCGASWMLGDQAVLQAKPEFPYTWVDGDTVVSHRCPDQPDVRPLEVEA